MARPVPAVLSIAGSDSGGGAGIQADLKAFARCGVHGMTAITALTAQSTVGVTAIHPVPGEFIVEQVRTVAADIGVDAVKIGMLGTAETVRAVREALRHIEDGVPIVIDPVMVAESGAVLLDDEARTAIVTELLPLATVITPNLPEARVLVAGAEAVRGGDGTACRGEDASRGDGALGRGGDTPPGGGPLGRSGNAPPGGGATDGGGAARSGDTSGWRGIDTAAVRDDVEDLARALHELGPANVVVTGGHRDEATDVFFDGTSITLLVGERHPDGAAHGSGCTHSSALAAHLALGFSPEDAARAARRLASEAVRDGHRGIGQGPGPVNVLGVAVRGRTPDGLARRA